MSIRRIGGISPHANAQHPAELEELEAELDEGDASEVAYSDPGAEALFASIHDLANLEQSGAELSNAGASSFLANVDDIAHLVPELAAQVAGTGVVEALEDAEGESS